MFLFRRNFDCVFINFLFVLKVCLTMASGSAVAELDREDSILGEITRGTNSFAFEFYRALSKENPTGNVFTSPLSLQVVMAMVYSGACGQTAAEIATVLKLPEGLGKVFEGYNSLMNILKNPVLNLANKIFLENMFSIKEDFNKNMVKYFESEVEKLNFASDSKGCKDLINSWVEKKTNHKIKDLIADGYLTPDTCMVVVNAIHFKADWKYPFSESMTYLDKFYINEKDTVRVQMMSQSDDFNYTEHSGLDAKILALPYEGNEFTMYIFLPNKINGLAALEENISKMDLDNALKDLSCQKVDVKIPKFEITQTIDLNGILKSIGVKTMFQEGTADFSGISNEPLVVSKVVQKAFIQVDEKGTEAAAATGFKIANRSFSIRERFRADHPFLFLISKRLKFNDEFIVFIGKLNGGRQ